MLEQRWRELITAKRFGHRTVEEAPSYRTTFQKDYDRLVFSAAFRRLQDKTQVFPLAQTDYIRTRLTHSLEVSSVCRSLGTMLGEYLVDRYDIPGITASSSGAILAAGALAHDIGNPPFGHAGEEAISRFFADNPIGQEALSEVSDLEKTDFLHFEGNAQAFRLLTKLQNSHNYGGMQLSLPVIASFIKYPCGSDQRKKSDHIAFHKFNYFQAEKTFFTRFAEEATLKPHETLPNTWYRHPFAYLLEAADDICYSLVDIEDAYRLKLISAEGAFEFYEAIITEHHEMPHARLSRIPREKDRVEYLRAYTIGILVDEIIKVFIENESTILEGKCREPLLSIIPSKTAIAEIKRFAYKNIYVSDPVLEVGIAGFKVLETLLEAFVGAVRAEARGQGSSKTRMLMEFMPDQFLSDNRIINQDPYMRYLQVTDFVSGMTDRYAIKVFKMITGVDLPV